MFKDRSEAQKVNETMARILCPLMSCLEKAVADQVLRGLEELRNVPFESEENHE